MELIPLLFQPVYSSNRNVSVVFKAVVPGYHMSKIEKNWLCFEVFQNDDGEYISSD
jgi:hypothetical protein